MNKTIFLIGLPGVGKTTLGSAVSARLEIPFIDLDNAIADHAGMSVSQIFAVEGEEGFRARESRMLQRLCTQRAIVACGGGTPCFNDNMKLMQNGTIVWLTAPLSLLAQRIAAQPGTRPLFAEGDIAGTLSELSQRRQPHYAKAHLTFDASSLDSEQQIDQSVSRFINEVISLL